MTLAPVNIHSLRLIDLPRHVRADGEVVVAQATAHVPFSIARMFTLRGAPGAERGKHAHRQCSQFMVCVHGAMDVTCDDGREKRTVALDRGNLALLVPPTIWNTVVSRQADAVLAVLCDRSYEEHDYIRDYAEFLNFRKVASQ